MKELWRRVGGGLLIEWMSGLVDEAKVKVKAKVKLKVASRASATGNSSG